MEFKDDSIKKADILPPPPPLPSPIPQRSIDHISFQQDQHDPSIKNNITSDPENVSRSMSKDHLTGNIPQPEPDQYRAWDNSNAADENDLRSNDNHRKGDGIMAEHDTVSSALDMVKCFVPETDDPNLPSLTFRVWALGIMFTVVLSIVNQFYWFRDLPVVLNIVVVQILAYPFGKALEIILPQREFTLSLWRNSDRLRWTFTLNPGKFNVKEHTLIVAFANSGASTAYAIDLIVVRKMAYHDDLSVIHCIVLLFSSQLLGYGLSGFVRSLLVCTPSMVWPDKLLTVVLLRSFHENSESETTFASKDGCSNDPSQTGETLKAKRQWKWSRLQMFCALCLVSFIWYLLPGFFFRSLTSLSLLCYAFPHNHLAHILGSGYHGLGFLSFTLDWNVVISPFLADPVSTPLTVGINVFCGFIAFMWVAVPLAYFFDLWDSAKLPLYDIRLWTTRFGEYNISSVMVDGTFNEDAYRNYGPVRLSTPLSLQYAVSFAGLASLISYVALYHGKLAMRYVTPVIHSMLSKLNVCGRRLTSLKRDKEKDDIHGTLMQNYPDIPTWWFVSLLVISIVCGMVACELFKFGLTWWGFLICLAIPFALIIPIGIVQALTNIQPGLGVVAEMIGGFLFPGRPVANMLFKVYGYITMTQGLSFTSDLKLGRYMKIPPRQMFMCQFVGTLLASVCQLSTTIFILDRVSNICTPSAFPWTCRSAHLFHTVSVLWGLVGPYRMFIRDSPYYPLFFGFLGGALLPILVYLLQRKFTRVRWLKHVNIPVALNGLSAIPMIPPLSFQWWFGTNILFNYVLRNYRKEWWKRYAFILSSALTTGLVFSGMFIFFVLSRYLPNVLWWGNRSEHCSLALVPWKKDQ
ncbi:hypothetical protein H4219_003495 [Mycoemilia scoparia]|uniref:Oligopeptide transporter n=1 Tax=Mycoemilia scoparia TaxID=417184 RepID=A0A9W8DMR2_9FUNG|nr:hypothetical protein H4219_003495 [Mycoemilia scoparia]